MSSVPPADKMEKEKTNSVMYDSGIASLQGSMTESASSECGGARQRAHSGASFSPPTVPEESALCRELGELKIAEEAVGPTAWKEYFEPDQDGDTQLHLALASDVLDVACALVRLAPSPHYLSLPNHAGYTPMHIAVLRNQPTIVRKLVVSGARLDVQDARGSNPMHLAAIHGRIECGWALLEPLAKGDGQDKENSTELPTPVQSAASLIDKRTQIGEHCVHLATLGGHAPFLRFLFQQGADMNALDGRAGRTALHLAVGAANLAVVQCLVDECGVDLDKEDWTGRTALQLAKDNGGGGGVAGFLARRMSNDPGPDLSVQHQETAIPSLIM